MQKTKGAKQLHGYCAADQRLCFHYIDGTIHLLPKSLTIFCGCTAQFVLDLAQNPVDGFSHDAAQMNPLLTPSTV